MVLNQSQIQISVLCSQSEDGIYKKISLKLTQLNVHKTQLLSLKNLMLDLKSILKMTDLPIGSENSLKPIEQSSQLKPLLQVLP